MSFRYNANPANPLIDGFNTNVLEMDILPQLKIKDNI